MLRPAWICLHQGAVADDLVQRRESDVGEFEETVCAASAAPSPWTKFRCREVAETPDSGAPDFMGVYMCGTERLLSVLDYSTVLLTVTELGYLGIIVWVPSAY